MGLAGNPTVRRRELGALLRRHRERLGLTAQQVAADLDVSPSQISRLETAQRMPQLLLVRALCRRYGLDDESCDHLASLARAAREQGWWQPYDLESPIATYLSLESAAATVDAFECMVVPGILQTAEYAELIIRSVKPDYSPSQVSRMVEARIRRRQALSGDRGLTFHAVVDETVLSRSVGSSAVMRDQARSLLAFAERPNVTIQILPLSAGSSPALNGPFSLFGFAEEAMGPVVYTEGQLGEIFAESPAVVERARQLFGKLVELALSARRSVELIASHNGI